MDAPYEDLYLRTLPRGTHSRTHLMVVDMMFLVDALLMSFITLPWITESASLLYSGQLTQLCVGRHWVTPYGAHIHQAPLSEFSWFAAPDARTLSPGPVWLCGQ
jgi:hypothetical protein